MGQVIDKRRHNKPNIDNNKTRSSVYSKKFIRIYPRDSIGFILTMLNKIRPFGIVLLKSRFTWNPVCNTTKRLITKLNHSPVAVSRAADLKSFLKVPLAFLFPVMAATSATFPELQKVIDESEALYENKDFTGTYNLLMPHKETNNANILWRLARAATEKGKQESADDRKRHIFEAWEYIKKALELDDKNFACHKWYGILLDYTAEYEGTKQRISNAFKCKEHFMKALELNPKDATTMYCLGYWCFLFADMPWYQRKVASVVFASPPTSTYDEALEYFKRAEETEPGFYNKNNLMLGQTYLRLKDKAQAKHWFQKAVDYPVKTEEDKQAVKEAEGHLKSL